MILTSHRHCLLNTLRLGWYYFLTISVNVCYRIFVSYLYYGNSFFLARIMNLFVEISQREFLMKQLVTKILTVYWIFITIKKQYIHARHKWVLTRLWRQVRCDYKTWEVFMKKCNLHQLSMHTYWSLPP